VDQISFERTAWGPDGRLWSQRDQAVHDSVHDLYDTGRQPLILADTHRPESTNKMIRPVTQCNGAICRSESLPSAAINHSATCP